MVHFHYKHGAKSISPTGIITTIFPEYSLNVRMRYQKVNSKGKKAWAQKTEKISATMNPFNRNAEGRPKSEEEIQEHLKVKAQEWIAKKTQEFPLAKFSYVWKALKAFFVCNFSIF